MSMIKSVIIIDDDEGIRFTLSEICKFAGYDVLIAVNGKEGLSLCKTHEASIIIVDYHMPLWDGMTTVKKIREVNQTAAILVLTVDERQEVSDQFIAIGATDFAIKPIKAPDLVARLGVNQRIFEMQKKLQVEKMNMFIDKGISSATLSIIMDFLKNSDEPRTIDDITIGVSLAYQTVHRYIQHMVSQNSIEVIPVYGQLGRPKNKYKLIDDPS